MNEWKAKVEALKAQRETGRGGSTIGTSSTRTPMSRSGTFSGSSAVRPVIATTTTSDAAGAACLNGHPMAATSSFCTTCGSKKAAATAAPSPTTTTTSSFRTSTTASPAPTTTTATTVTITPTPAAPKTTTPTAAAVVTSTPSPTPSSSSGPSSALDRFRSRVSPSSDSLTRTGSAPNLSTLASSSPPASPIPSSSSSSSSTSSSSVPPLTGTPEQQLDELKKLYASKSAECDQLKSKLMSGLPSATGGAGGSQTALLEGKVKSLETKIASEIRQRELAEKRYEATKQELDDMKKRREAARQRMQSKASTDASAAKARNAVAAGRGAGPAGAGAGAGAGGVRAPSKRATRVVSTKGPPVSDIVTRILAEMARVEAAIKKAEEDRVNAENELLEVGCFKQAAEDRFNELTTIVEQVAVLVNNLQILIVTKCGSVPDVKAALQDLHGKLDSLATRAAQLSKGAAASSHAAVTDFAVRVGAPPPPPPPLPGAPSFSSPAASSSAGARASTLLSQIRKGATLKSLDATAIKKERDEKANAHRKSVTMLSALQDTLRSALANRQDSMNPDSDEEGWDGDY